MTPKKNHLTRIFQTMLAVAFLSGLGCASNHVQIFCSYPSFGKTDVPGGHGPAQLTVSSCRQLYEMLSYAKQARFLGSELVIFWLAQPGSFHPGDKYPWYLLRHIREQCQGSRWVAAGLAEIAPGQGVNSSIHNAYDSGLWPIPWVKLCSTIENTMYFKMLSIPRYANSYLTRAAVPMLPVLYPTSWSQKPLSDALPSLFALTHIPTYNPVVLEKLNSLKPDLVIVIWGVTAGSQAKCSTPGFNATDYAGMQQRSLQWEPMLLVYGPTADICRLSTAALGVSLMHRNDHRSSQHHPADCLLDMHFPLGQCTQGEIGCEEGYGGLAPTGVVEY